jgi:23S rRNA (cytidine1920-2'-O)/16S rRNA (cytidine1409-2'-O)-methyltransferase
MTFEETLPIEVKGSTLRYVSRGGLKLEKAVNEFELDLTGKICMDIGASTGGFTDCMLQNGAVKVYAVDSGRGQLDWKLRQDERVICLEKTNARYLNTEIIPEPIDFFSVDVCFISLTKILEPAYALLKEDGQAVCLIKPQFEAGREKVGKKGVVRDKNVHKEVVNSLLLYAQSIGFCVLGLEYSPIRGPEGNIEYLMYLKKNSQEIGLSDLQKRADEIVEQAHQTL